MTMCEGAESLCRYAWLCGAACLQACDQTKPTKGDLELSLQQTGCKLSWTTQTTVTDLLPVYLVVEEVIHFESDTLAGLSDSHVAQCPHASKLSR